MQKELFEAEMLYEKSYEMLYEMLHKHYDVSQIISYETYDEFW